jgi:hypothetical protein
LPDAPLPDAVQPDAPLPDASLPDASLPDAPLPDASLPDTVGPICGNNSLETGEQCDPPGDCCDASCQYKSTGTSCGDGTNSACTDPDTCNATGSCLANHAPNGTGCTIGACQSGVCQPTSDILDIPISQSSDDAEERLSDGDMDLTSSDLEMVYDSNDDLQAIGLRFANVAVPQGASITSTYLQFTADSSSSGTINLSIVGQAADNAPTFSPSSNNITNRLTGVTTSSVSWSPPNWSGGDAGGGQQTNDLSAIVQEIVNRPGWNSGQSMVFIITSTSTSLRRAFTWDASPSDAAVLHVEYSGGGADPDLVVYYTFDDGTATDLSGNNNHGIITGATASADAKSGQALDFDGNNDAVDMGDLDMTGPFTLGFWVKVDILSKHWQVFVMKPYDYGISVEYSNVWASIGDGYNWTKWSNQTAHTPLSQTGTWYHLAMTYDGSQVLLYRDGAHVDSATGSHSSNNDKLWIGAWQGNEDSLDGRIDEVRIYSRVLSQGEILTMIQ